MKQSNKLRRLLVSQVILDKNTLVLSVRGLIRETDLDKKFKTLKPFVDFKVTCSEF